MAKIHKAEAQFEVKCNADKFYDIYRNKVIHLSKILPEVYNSIQVLEGDGRSVGTVRLWKFAIGDSPKVSFCKEKLTAVEDKSRSITFCISEGDLSTHYESLDLKLTVTPKGTEGSIVQWYLDFEKKTQDSPPPDALLDLLGKITKALEVYLLKALP